MQPLLDASLTLNVVSLLLLSYQVAQGQPWAIVSKTACSFLKRHVRSSKYEPIFDEVELTRATLSDVHFR